MCRRTDKIAKIEWHNRFCAEALEHRGNTGVCLLINTYHRRQV